MKTLTPLLLALAFLLYVPLTAEAQKPKTTDGQKADAAIETTNSPTISLAAKAAEKGWVRVIVNLKTDFKAEGDLAPSAVVDQQVRIKQTQENVLKQLSTNDVVLHRRFEYIPGIAVSVTPQGLAELEAMPEVASVVEDGMNTASLDKSTGIIGATHAWNGGGFTGKGWTVAVLDTGFDVNHPFLQGKVLYEACFSTSYIPGAPNGSVQSLCSNGQNSQFGAGSSYYCTGVDGCEHGTHVAGIVAGKYQDFSGVAPDATLITIQVFTRINDEDYCGGVTSCITAYNSNIIAGLEQVYALRNQFKIASVNMSLGGGEYTDPCDNQQRATKAAIDNLRSVGIATVIASGNDGYANAMGAPACITSAISVGATDDNDTITDFSNDAYFLSLLAPGKQIYSSIPGGGYESLNGTSMAAPHVAGAWAIRKQVQPTASVDDILAYFKRTGKSIKSVSGITFPRIQVDKEMPFVDMEVTFSVNKPEIAYGDTLVTTYKVKNTGAYPLTLSTFFGNKFTPNPLPVGQTATATEQAVITDQDLPGPYTAGDLIAGKYGTLSVVKTVQQEVGIAALSVEDSLNSSFAEVGSEIAYYYDATNLGSVDLTLSVEAERKSSQVISDPEIAPNNKTEIDVFYNIKQTDLPGPMTNKVTIIGTTAKGTKVSAVSNLSVDLIESLPVDPRSQTTQVINTAQNIVSMEFPPASLSTFVTDVAYVKQSTYPRLPAVSAGLVFDSIFRTSTSAMLETQAPFTFTLRYQDNQLPTTVPETELTVYHYDLVSKTWVIMPFIMTDTVANTVVFTSTELGQYALTGHPYTHWMYLPIIERK